MKRLLAVSVFSLLAASAHAGPVTYTGVSVLNPQTVVLNSESMGIRNEAARAGQITLTGTNTPGGTIASWSIDIANRLQNAGSFTVKDTSNSQFNRTVNALISHVAPSLSSNPDSSAALQVAIWRAEYGHNLGVSTSEMVGALAANYLSQVESGAWKADPRYTVATLSANGSNQDQVYLVGGASSAPPPAPVPEPASLMILGCGLLGLGIALRMEKRP